jgi:hypothetical protein
MKTTSKTAQKYEDLEDRYRVLSGDYEDVCERLANAERRLAWMISRSAYISHSRDGEVCSVWMPSDQDDGQEHMPVEGYPQKCYYDPYEAIDRAIKAEGQS